MRDGVGSEIDRDVGDIGQVRVDVAISRRFDVERIFVEQIVHDREIMRPQIP
jgi:hypothetical protein